MITVNVAAEKRSADYWILDTGVTNHVTGNQHLSSLLSFDWFQHRGLYTPGPIVFAFGELARIKDKSTWSL